MKEDQWLKKKQKPGQKEDQERTEGQGAWIPNNMAEMKERYEGYANSLFYYYLVLHIMP